MVVVGGVGGVGGGMLREREKKMKRGRDEVVKKWEMKGEMEGNE